MSTLTVVLLVLLVVVLAGGGLGYSRLGAASFSPLALVLIVLLILWVTGNVHLR